VAALLPHGLAALPIDVVGGIALNGPVGGINPHAVDLTLRMGGRVVWLPTIGARRHIAFHCEHPDAFPHPQVDLLGEQPIAVIGDDGELTAELREILRLIAEADAVLASGHLGPAELVRIFEAARDAGVRRLLLNHPNFIIEAGVEDANRLVELGAYVEHNLSLYDEDSVFRRWPVEELARWIAAVGADRTILASDLGQKANPLPIDSYRKICDRLLDCGIGERAIRRIVAANPAELLGLAR
jgi:hypothetical protein